MRTLLPLAAVVALAAPLRAAPVPNEKPLPAIDGKYNLVSLSTPDTRIGPGGGFAPAGGGFPGGGGGVMVGRVSAATALLLGPAHITKNEITLEGRPGVVSPLSVVAAGTTLPMTMTYTLDKTKTPMTIDVETSNLRGKKTKTLGLVEVIDNRLVIALAGEGGERPKTTDEGEGITVYYFQKAPPPPKAEVRIVAMTVGKEAETEKELNKLLADGFELVSTTNPVATDAKASPTTVHFILKRTTK
jgi:hypothetical protein